MRQTVPKDAAELDAAETREWLESLDYVVQQGGPFRAARLLRQLEIHARKQGVKLPFTANTPYVNSLPADLQVPMPGSNEIERRIKSLIRWNALAMVVRANRVEDGIGGHISTYASAATLYEVGFNHFFRGDDGHATATIFFQGHAAPGIYARASSKAVSPPRSSRTSAASCGGGLSSYPHPWLMPDFWEFPTRFDGARADRRHLPRAVQPIPRRPRHEGGRATEGLGFLGDGETDEPESLGAITFPSREKLDNLDLRRQLQLAAA